MDYQANSNRSKTPGKGVEPQKKIEKVVTGEVISRKKPLGRKFKDVFVNADAKSVVVFVISDVLVPAARNMIVDAVTKGIERMAYGDKAVRRREYGTGPRYSYNTPVDRNPRPAPTLPARRTATLRQSNFDFVLSSREEAEIVLERMQDIINMYDVVSVGDLNELLGLPTTSIDNNWGWEYLANAQIRQVREGYLIDFPPADPI